MKAIPLNGDNQGAIFMASNPVQEKRIKHMDICYDPGPSLRKRNDLQGKDGSTSSLLNLANGLAQVDMKNNVSGTRTGGSKGESVAMAAEAGAEDTSSNGYR